MNHPLTAELEAFREFGRATRVENRCLVVNGGTGICIPVYTNEFWPAKPQQNSLHEISYPRSFQAELPRFFIDRFTQEGDIVYDPYMGRHTTGVEAALRGRMPWGNDVSLFCTLLARPRLNPPTLQQVSDRLAEINFGYYDHLPDHLRVFYHPETLKQLCSLRRYLLHRQANGAMDSIDEWIFMVALDRLTGRSLDCFSVYIVPDDHGVSAEQKAILVERQNMFNAEREQLPPMRLLTPLIMKKTRRLLRDCSDEVLRKLQHASAKARFWSDQAERTPHVPSDSVTLIVTSPPLPDEVDHDITDKWMRCWFTNMDFIWGKRDAEMELESWETGIEEALSEMRRVLRPGGHVAFEVTALCGGTIKLEESVIPAGAAAGLEPVLVLINDQNFGKPANGWSVDNNNEGNSANRIVLFQKPMA